MEHLCQLAAKEAKKGEESLWESEEKKKIFKNGLKHEEWPLWTIQSFIIISLALYEL